MSINFRAIAQEATTLSDLMADRTKITVEEIISSYPDGITVTGFDLVPAAEGDAYYIGIFAEDNSRFFNGGVVFGKICEKWGSGYDTREACNEDLYKFGGVKLKFAKGMTKNKQRNVTTVTVV